MMDRMLPKYFAIKKDILNKIDEEIYKPDEAIPPERELMEMYNVSRITVRRAVDELVSECYLYKIHGKGTYVKGNSRTMGLSVVKSCSEEIRQQGFTPSRKILSIETESCSKKLARELDIQEGSPVLHLQRVYYADEEAVIYCESFIVLEYFPGIENKEFNERSLYDIIENDYHTEIVDSVRYIEAVAAYENVADSLNLANGYPTLRFHGTTRANINNRVTIMEAFDSNYVTGKIKFRIDQKAAK